MRTSGIQRAMELLLPALRRHLRRDARAPLAHLDGDLTGRDAKWVLDRITHERR